MSARAIVAEQASSDVVEQDRAPVPAAITALFTDAAGHVADALPEILVLARGGVHFEKRVRPYLNETIHCLASALEACLIASHDAEQGGLGEPRRGGEADLTIYLRDFLDQVAA